MKKFLTLSLLIVMCVSTFACSSLRFPGVYRLRIAQGNYIEQKMIDQLEVGMTKRQVRFVMGTPLVEDTFNPDRWDYYFNVRLDEKTLREYHFAVFFDEKDTLVRWDGDYEPTKKTELEAQKEALEQTKKKEDAKFKSNDERRF